MDPEQIQRSLLYQINWFGRSTVSPVANSVFPYFPVASHLVPGILETYLHCQVITFIILQTYLRMENSFLFLLRMVLVYTLCCNVRDNGYACEANCLSHLAENQLRRQVYWSATQRLKPKLVTLTDRKHMLHKSAITAEMPLHISLHVPVEEATLIVLVHKCCRSTRYRVTLCITERLFIHPSVVN